MPIETLRNDSVRHTDPARRIRFAMPHTTEITQAKPTLLKALFDRDGYISLDNVTTAGELTQIGTLLDPLFARFDSLGELAIELSGAHRAGTPLRSPEINQPSVLEPRLKATPVFERCRHIARELLGAPAGFLFDHAIYKLPRSHAPTHWHQDQAYAHAPIPLRSIHFWIPLQAATIENGCMWYIPGSHCTGLIPHIEVSKRYAASSDHSLGSTLALSNVDETKARACPVAAGGVAIHHPLTIHCAGANQSDEYRRAWILQFGAYGRWRFRLHPRCIVDRVIRSLGRR